MRRRPAVTILMLVIVVILTLPLRAQQKIVAPTFRSACADLKVSATTAGFSPAKPFTQEQVSNMVRAGLGDDSGAKLIEQRGIDFAPTEDFLQTLKATGGGETCSAEFVQFKLCVSSSGVRFTFVQYYLLEWSCCTAVVTNSNQEPQSNALLRITLRYLL